MTRILVAYASKFHSTAEIAEEIGRALRHTPGLNAVVQDVSTVTDVGQYDAVVLGSAVYSGQWHPDAAAFLKQHEKELAQRPVWVFSSGPTGRGSPKELTHGWDFPTDLRPIADRIHVRDKALFHGKLDAQSLNDPQEFGLGQRLVMKVVHPPLGDFRDWDVIRGWANRIAEALRNPALHDVQ